MRGKKEAQKRKRNIVLGERRTPRENQELNQYRADERKKK